MSDPIAREWRFYIDDMIGFADKVIAYTAGLDQERFVASGLNYDATLRNLGIDNDTLWSIVVSDVPALLISLRSLEDAAV